jgi:uncharacterized protein YbjT (DUF2867 family)
MPTGLTDCILAILRTLSTGWVPVKVDGGRRRSSFGKDAEHPFMISDGGSAMVERPLGWIPVILVAGGTGTLGSKLVPLLLERHAPVRVMTRDPARARHLEAPGVEIVVGDVRDRESLSSAVKGVEIVISSIQGFVGPGQVIPISVDREGNANLVAAARANNSDFVLVSAVSVSQEHPWDLLREKYAAEQHLQRSGLRWTILRPSVFTETWGHMMLTSLLKSGKIKVFGRGENPANYVSVIDVAALVERAVGDTDLRGRVIELGGPDELTSNQLAEVVQEVAGRRASVSHISRPALRIMGLAAKPFNPQMARMARASLVIDSTPSPFDPAPTRAEFPDLPETDVRTALRLINYNA